MEKHPDWCPDDCPVEDCEDTCFGLAKHRGAHRCVLHTWKTLVTRIEEME